MRQFILSSLLLLLQTAALAAPATPPSIVPIQHWQSEHNVPVYFVERHELPVVDIGVLFYAGTAYDGNKPGLARLTNLMLNEGTTTLDTDTILTRLDSVGAVYSNDVTRDLALVSLRTLTHDAIYQQATSTFIDILNHPNFPEVAFEREQARTIEQIKALEQSPGDLANQKLYETLFAHSPYGTPILGNRASINAMADGDLIEFWRHYYTANNAKIVIVGDLTKAAAVTLANQLIANLPAGQRQVVAEVPLKNISETVSADFPASQNNIRLATLGIKQNCPEQFPLTVANTILGGPILGSILNSEIREKYGLTYGIYSNFDAMQTTGPFIISFSSRNDQAERAIMLTQQLLKDYVQHGPTEAQVKFAKQYLISNFPVKLDNNSAILANVERIAAYDLPLDYLDQYRSKIEAVTSTQITAALQHYLHPEQLLIVKVGPHELTTKATTPTQ